MAEQLAELNKGDDTRDMLGTPIDITSYDTATNYYTCPSDGYVLAYVDASGNIGVRISGKNHDFGSGKYINIFLRDPYNAMPVFVKKGMTVYVDEHATGSRVRFFALKS